MDRKEYIKQYNIKNKDKVNKQHREYRLKNKDKVNEYYRQYDKKYRKTKQGKK